MSGRRLSVRRSAAFMAAALLHAGLLAVLAHFLALTPHYPEARVIQVTLASPFRKAEPPPDRRERRESPTRTPAPARLASPQASPVAPRVVAGGKDGVAARAPQALRGLEGCERQNLTREEREACETSRWAYPPPAMARLNLDPTGRYAENPEPFLSRRPTKGCRVRATGDTDTMGDSGHARAGVTCVIPF